MVSAPPSDNNSTQQAEDRAEPAGSDPGAAALVGPAEPTPWRRISFWRSFIFLMIPVSILILISGLLALGIQVFTPENSPTLQFWFYFFDVGREINVPTWFGAGMWITAGILAGYFARSASRNRVFWALFAVVCIFFSIDETLELHERLDVIGNELSQYVPLQLGFTWVIPGILIAALIVLVLLRMVFTLPRGPRTGLLAAGVIFIGGGVGVESLSGLFIQGAVLPWQFFLLTLIEEAMEMTGIALCIASLAHLIAYRHSGEGSTAYRVADSAPAKAASAVASV